jgi:cellulose biosynthesis protein BcsQ
MVTLCWAAKGGSGTTVVTAALALGLRRHSLLVDLDGEIPAVLGMPDPDRPGVDDWLRSDAPAEQLGELVVDVDATTSLLPHRRSPDAVTSGGIVDARWSAFAHWLRRQHDDGIEVFVDGGSAPPHERMVAAADQVLLVTRPCYLSLRRARRSSVRPTGVILVDEPGRTLGTREIERCLGAPVVATVSTDPKLARAVDAGLLTGRLPWVIGRELRRVAA